MGEGGESRARESRVDASPDLGAIRVIRLDAGVGLYFPPLRTAGAALMLALFGIACTMIGLAAIAGLVRSGDTQAASMLALAFAGVFALPLLLLGQFFIVTALWTAGNSLYVEVLPEGIRTERKWFGYGIARRAIAATEISAVESRLAAKYLSFFSSARYYRMFAATRSAERPLLIADTLHGTALTEEIRQLVVEHLREPALLTAGRQAHAETADS